MRLIKLLDSSVFCLLFIGYIGKPSITLLNFIMIAESYEINRQTSYDSGILRPEYRIIQGLPMNHTRFADWVTNWVVHLPERTETGGLITASEQTVKVVHSCSS